MHNEIQLSLQYFLDAGKKECLQLLEQIDTEQDGEGILSLQCAYLLN